MGNGGSLDNGNEIYDDYAFVWVDKAGSDVEGSPFASDQPDSDPNETTPTGSKTIGHVDADGVALAAIQGLSEKLEDTREELDDVTSEMAAKDERIDDLEAENDRLREENDRLRERVETIEDRLDIDA